jgi:biofilm protein TabA
MIVADLEFALQQAALSSAMRKGLDFLEQAQNQDLPDGRIEIDGSTVYALVQSYTSKPRDGIRFEAHRKYVDLQYVVDGEEYEGWASLPQMDVTDAYNPEKDIARGTAPAADLTLVRLKAGQLAIFYPTDAHAPGLAIDAPMPIKKIVVKVAVEEAQ